jgi:phasin family protein
MAQSSHSNDTFNPTRMLEDFSKMMQQYKVPGLDMAAIMEARRKDFEALATANKTALEGMQALGEKQAEMWRHTLTELQALIQHAARSGSAGESPVKKGELVQKAFQGAVANMRELAEAGARTQTDAFAVINKRVQENMQELTKLLQPKH